MVYAVFLNDGSSSKDNILIKEDEDGIIIVPKDYIPLKIDLTHYSDIFGTIYLGLRFENKPGENIYVLRLIDRLCDEFCDSENILNKELAENIHIHFGEEGWIWDIDTSSFKEVPKPSELINYGWVDLTNSWMPVCDRCGEKKCLDVHTLSKEINRAILTDMFCNCEKCDDCGLIYDYECPCRPNRQKQSHDSSDSCFVRCEVCCRMYDAFDCASAYIHDGRC